MAIMREFLKALIHDMQLSPALFWVGVAMAVDFAICLILMMFDSRQVTGVNVWLKPSKFAISSAMTILSLAWIASKISDWPRTKKWASRCFALSMAIDVAIIDIQAGRGTTSHFNMATSLDRAAYLIMGFFIGVLWISMAVMTFALFRQKFATAAWAWALRLGLLLSLLGTASGGFMLRPTSDQMHASERLHAGAHTVGAPDGGPGIAFANWSTQHGDLRVAHFLGLHAVQIIPVIGFWLVRRRGLDEPQKLRMVFIAVGTYLGIFALLTWQALRGQALLRPDAKTLTTAGVLAIVSVLASVFVLYPSVSSGWLRTLEVDA